MVLCYRVLANNEEWAEKARKLALKHIPGVSDSDETTNSPHA